MTNRILVTGGAGFIGSHLVDALVAHGHEVTVLDDFSTGEKQNIDAAMQTGKVRLVTGSILDPAAVREAMEGCDRVYHLAVQCVRRSLGNPMQSHDVNATGTLIVLEEARRRRVSRFIYCSSSEVYGSISEGLLTEDMTCRPVTVYGGAKLAGELYADAYYQTYQLPVVIARPFNAYGPRAHESGDLAEVLPRFFIRILNGLPPVIFGDGSNARDFTHVSDVARGLMLAGDTDRLVGQRVNIAYGRMINMKEVAETALQALGRGDLSMTFHAPRPGDVHCLNADTRKAAELLGYKASIVFADGVARYAEWFKAKHPDPSGLLEEKIENWTLPETER